MTERKDIGYELDKILQAVVREERGPEGFTYHDYKGNPLPMPDPDDWSRPLAISEVADPLLRVELAKLISAHAVGLVREACSAARAAGLPWDALADVLKVDKELDDRAVAAFEAVTPEQVGYFRERVFRFKCGTCNQHITDHGPYDGYPSDCEIGHGTGCARMEAADAAYDLLWED